MSECFLPKLENNLIHIKVTKGTMAFSDLLLRPVLPYWLRIKYRFGRMLMTWRRDHLVQKYNQRYNQPIEKLSWQL